MKPDDELCLCFHVSRRKVEQYVRARRPAVASQLSECYGAGTGCGWCRPFLRRLHQQIVVSTSPQAEAARAAGVAIESIPANLPDAESYAAERESYRAAERAGADPSPELSGEVTPLEPQDGGPRPGTQDRIPRDE